MFQQQVYITPAVAVPGDFASANYGVYKVASGTTHGKMVADAAGVTVGRFCVLNANGTCTSIPGAAPTGGRSRIGFVSRGNGFVAQNTIYAAEYSYTIAPGQAVPAWGQGDWFVLVDAITGTPSRGAAVMWDTTTGLINIGGTTSATVIDTGYVMLSEAATVGAIVIISNQGA